MEQCTISREIPKGKRKYLIVLHIAEKLRNSRVSRKEMIKFMKLGQNTETVLFVKRNLWNREKGQCLKVRKQVKDNRGKVK